MYARSLIRNCPRIKNTLMYRSSYRSCKATALLIFFHVELSDFYVSKIPTASIRNLPCFPLIKPVKGKTKTKTKKQVSTRTCYWMIKKQAKWENVCSDSAPLTAPSRAYSGRGGKRGRRREKEGKRKEQTKHSFNQKFLYSSDP